MAIAIVVGALFFMLGGWWDEQGLLAPFVPKVTVNLDADAVCNVTKNQGGSESPPSGALETETWMRKEQTHTIRCLDPSTGRRLPSVPVTTPE